MIHDGITKDFTFLFLSLTLSAGILITGCAKKDNPSTHPDGWIDPEAGNFHGNKIAASGIGSCAECHGENYLGGSAEVACNTCHEGGESGHPALLEWINPTSDSYHGRIFWENGWDFSHCQECHGTNLNQGTTINQGCQTSHCHTGSNGIYSCDNCHSYGTDISVFFDVHNNSSSDSTAVGAHLSHINAVHDLGPELDCNVCHEIPDSVYQAGHLEASQKIDFNNFATAGGSLSATWDGHTGTCKNTYCHGTAQPAWTSSDGSDLTCGVCHNATAPDSAHAAHTTTAGYECVTCHTGYDLSTEKVAATHINGLADVLLSTQVGGSYDSDAKTCANVYCHSSDTPDWDVVDGTHSACGSCHDLPPDNGAHITHVTDQGYSCSDCHSFSDSTHIDFNVDVAINTQYGGTFDSQSQSCSNVACHGGTTISWTGQTLTCGSCHDLPPDNGAHIVHVTGLDNDCGVCHEGYSAVSEEVSATDHINLQTNVTLAASYGGSYDTTASTCSSVYCHSGATPDWFVVDGTYSSCGACHSLPPATNAHTTHVDDLELDCDYCHADYSAVNQLVSATDHINLEKDVTILTSVGGAYDTTSSTCSEVRCHGIGTPDWTSTPAFTCVDCHGGVNDSTGAPPYDLAGNLSDGAVGAHQVHLTAGDFTTSVECSECHQVPASVSAAGHFGTDLQAEITFGSLATDSGRISPNWDQTSSTCSDVYCHGNFSFHEADAASADQWVYTAADSLIIGTNPTLAWNSLTDLTCGDCHDRPPVGHSNLTTCGSCHTGVVDGNDHVTIIDKIKHINGAKNVYGN